MYTTSTQTFVIYSNIPVDLDQAYTRLTSGNFVTDGEILSCKFKQRDATHASCLNCLTISLHIKKPPVSENEIAQVPPKSNRGRKPLKIKPSGKVLNVKLFRNGSTQVTGCKTIDHVKFSMDMVYNLLDFDRVDEFHIVSIMNNVNFSVNFKINRERLGAYLIEKGINVPPITSGYMGIKIRIPSLVDKNDLRVPRMSWSKTDGFTSLSSVPYVHFFADKPKKIDKVFSTCIGIFQNGKILMTSLDGHTTDVMYKYITNLLEEARPFIEVREKIVKTFKR